MQKVCVLPAFCGLWLLLQICDKEAIYVWLWIQLLSCCVWGSKVCLTLGSKLFTFGFLLFTILYYFCCSDSLNIYKQLNFYKFHRIFLCNYLKLLGGKKGCYVFFSYRDPERGMMTFLKPVFPSMHCTPGVLSPGPNLTRLHTFKLWHLQSEFQKICESSDI